MSTPTIEETLGELDAGIFMQKASEALKQVAIGAITTGKKGSVTITLELDQIGESDSVQVKHTLKYSKPTKNGKFAEENATSTPLYVDKHGYLTISPQTQHDIFNNENNVTTIRGAK